MSIGQKLTSLRKAKKLSQLLLDTGMMYSSFVTVVDLGKNY